MKIREVSVSLLVVSIYDLKKSSGSLCYSIKNINSYVFIFKFQIFFCIF